MYRTGEFVRKATNVGCMLVARHALAAMHGPYLETSAQCCGVRSQHGGQEDLMTDWNTMLDASVEHGA